MTSTTIHLDTRSPAAVQRSTELVSELYLMRYSGKTWTTHVPGSDSILVIAHRLGELHQAGAVASEEPATVVTGTPECAEVATRLGSMLPDLRIRNLAADDRLGPGLSRTAQEAVAEETDVRVISYRRLREAWQSLRDTRSSVVFLDQGERLSSGGKDYDFAAGLASPAPSVHLFASEALFAHPVSTFYLASVLRLPGFPRSLQRFKTAYVRSVGYGMNEVMQWRPSAVEELTELLDVHHFYREHASTPLR